MKFKLFILFILGLFIAACNPENNIGEGLLVDEKLDVNFTNNFDLKTRTIPGEDITSFSFTTNNLGQVSVVNPLAGMVGEFVDPRFGKITSDLYTRIAYNPNFGTPDFTNLILDSAVLVMAWDTLSFIGDFKAPVTITIEEIADDFEKFDTIKISKSLSVKSFIVGEKTFVPNFKDSISIINYLDSTNLRLTSRLRVPLDVTWAREFVFNPKLKPIDGVEANLTLYNAMKGLKLSATSNGKSILAFDLNPSAIGANGFSRLECYFKSVSGIKSVYQFYISTQRFNSIKVDNTQSEVKSFLNDLTKGNDKLFLQGGNGPTIEIDLNDLTALKDKIVNHAELELTLSNDGLDYDKYKPVTQILTSYRNASGDLVLISDIAKLVASNQSLILGYDGSYLSGNPGKYFLNITNHIKELIKDPTISRKIYLSVSNRAERLNSTAINGPKNSTNPLKLKVTYTNK